MVRLPFLFCISNLNLLWSLWSLSNSKRQFSFNSSSLIYSFRAICSNNLLVFLRCVRQCHNLLLKSAYSFLLPSQFFLLKYPENRYFLSAGSNYDYECKHSFFQNLIIHCVFSCFQPFCLNFQGQYLNLKDFYQQLILIIFLSK